MAERRPRREGLRRDEILRALVEEHIRSGEPVSSRAILEVTGLGVSAATVRSELASLERDGYAVQPHTSAGRVPTARAYRYYVDHIASADLPRSRHRQVDRFYSSVQLELGRLLKATTELLAEITHYPAVAVTSGPAADVVRAVHLVQLGATSALLVVVTASGRVLQDVCRFPSPVSPGEVESAEEVLSRAAVGSEAGAVTVASDEELAPPVESIVAVAMTERLIRPRPPSTSGPGRSRLAPLSTSPPMTLPMTTSEPTMRSMDFRGTALVRSDAPRSLADFS